jgi:hypothetical protein
MNQSVPAVVVDQKKVTTYEQTLPRFLDQAKDVAIQNNEDYQYAGTLLQSVVDKKREVEEFFEAPTKAANFAHKFITGMRSRFMKPLEEAEKILKAHRGSYRYELERERQRLEEEARVKAKQDQEAEAMREAARLHEAGEKEAAEAVIQEAVMSPAPAVFIPSTLPKEANKSIRKVYKFKVTNPALVKDEFKIVNEKAVKALVDKLGFDAIPIIGPGIEVEIAELESVRSTKNE